MKINFGNQSKQMAVRKMVLNFLRQGKLTTTEARAKILKPVLERLVTKAKIKSEANKNFLLRKIGDQKLVKRLFKEIGPIFKKRIGGYVRIIKLNLRESDGAKMARIEWVEKINEQMKEEKSHKMKKKRTRSKKVIETTKKLEKDS